MHDFEDVVARIYLEWLEDYFEVNYIKAVREYARLEEALRIAEEYEDFPREDLTTRQMRYLVELHPSLEPGDEVYLEGGVYDGEIHREERVPEGYEKKYPVELVGDLPVWEWKVAIED